MSAQRPRQRLPVSCEPCRVRKIRCPRDTPPCGTCVRRHVAADQCVYSTRERAPISSQRQRNQSQGNDVASLDSHVRPSSHDPAAERSADLVNRIEKLEQLLHAKNQQDTAPDPELVERGPEPPAGTGTLISSTSGHVRFLPMTSGWRIVHRAAQEGSLLSPENTITDTPSGPYPFGEHDTENRPNLLAKLPPTNYCDQLKDVYFQSFAPLFPILHSPTFHDRYGQFCKDPDQVSLEWLALLFTILGTAVLALEHDSPMLEALSRRPTPWDRVTELSERYYTAAMKCLEADRYLWRHNVVTLQALLNLIYGIHHSHGQMWTLLGLVYHLALSIGCHIDPAAFSLPAIEAEERRRCWLGLTTLLCNQNMAMTGFDIYPSVSSSRVLPPAETWDQDIIQGRPGPTAPSSGMKPVSYLIRKSRLFTISSEICNPILAAQPDNPTALHHLDAAIQAEIAPLEQSYASILEDDIDPSVVHTNLLLSFAHHLILLLHSNILKVVPFNLPQHSWSKHRCMQSAQRVLELHAHFHQSPQFMPFYWYIRGRGAFHAFHAAFVLILIICMEPKEPCPANAVRLVHECHARLEASRAQSQLCTRTAIILGQMLARMGAQGLGSGPPVPTEINALDQPVALGNGPAFVSDHVDLPNLVRQVEPQQWINPMDMDWDQWDLIMASLATTS